MEVLVINVAIKSATAGSPKGIHMLVYSTVELVYSLNVNIIEALPLGREADP